MARQIAEGLVPSGTQLTPPPDDIPAWDTLSSDEQRLFVHQQATYAGFLEHTDEQIGRLLGELAGQGLLDTTLVMVFSDNGAVMEGGRTGAVDTVRYFAGIDCPVAEQLKHIGDIGGPFCPAHYPMGWGMAGNTPFRRFKQFVDLGGVRLPLVTQATRISTAGACWTRSAARTLPLHALRNTGR